MAGVVLAFVTFSIGLMLAVLVAGSASAKTSPKKTTATSPAGSLTTPTLAPADKFSVINGTVNAASDHEIVGSSAFPNYTTGAVDNYYSMAHSHVDNSPFAEGTASPFDTGPVGQTAAAGNFQQPQYADARWPGGPDKAAYGSQGGPDATAGADNDRAKADASEASNAMSGPGLNGTKTLAVPKGFDDRLQQALAVWNAKWHGCSVPKSQLPAVPTPKVPVPKVVPTTPTVTVKTPIGTVTTPHVGGVSSTPSTPALPSAGAMGPQRSLASVPTLSCSPPSAPTSGGTESALSSSTLATLVYKTGKSTPDTSENNTCETDTVGATGTTTTTTTTTGTTTKTGTCELVTSGESSVGRVTIGGGQIVIDGIHVTASITNDGTSPSYKAAISVASASIGGIPVTIDENGVHLAGQGQGLPYKQASDSLNGALNKAGIQIFLVAPEVTNCSQTGSGTGTGTTATTTTTTTTTTSGQSGTTSSCGQSGPGATCDQSGTGSGGTPGVPAPAPTTTTTQSSTTTTSSPCDQNGTTGTCDQGTGTGGTTTTTTSGSPGIGSTTTTTNQSSTTTTPSSCDQSGMSAPTSSCSTSGTSTGATTASNDQSAAAPPMSGSTFQFGPGPGTGNSGEETVTATGVHIVFTQPVSPSGVPAQYVEHIVGEVFVDSLATPATPLPNVPFSSSSLSSSSSSSSCLGAGTSRSKASGSGLTAGGSSSIAGSTPSGSGSLSASGAISQPNASSTGNTLPARFASALRKPLWLLLAYVVWQVLVIGTGWSLWHWRRGGAT
ncbi:MAG: hypothetical protein ACRDLE_11970 [Gaiellaceae bacterium]